MPAQRGFVTLGQFHFYLTMAGERAFLANLRGVAAAAFQAGAKAEIGRAFGPNADGMLTDPVQEALARAIEQTVPSFVFEGVDIGSQVMWCLLPMMEAVTKARDVARFEPAPAP